MHDNAREINPADTLRLDGEMIVVSAASAGLARGRALLCGCARNAVVPRRRIDGSEAQRELERFDEAVETNLTHMPDDVRRTIGQAEAENFGDPRILTKHKPQPYPKKEKP